MNYFNDTFVVMCYKIVCSLSIAMAIVNDLESTLSKILLVIMAVCIAFGVIRVAAMKFGKAQAKSIAVVDRLLAGLPGFTYACLIDVLVAYINGRDFVEEASFFALLAVAEITAAVLPKKELK
jgi:hypothetical protein